MGFNAYMVCINCFNAYMVASFFNACAFCHVTILPTLVSGKSPKKFWRKGVNGGSHSRSTQNMEIPLQFLLVYGRMKAIKAHDR